MDDPHWFYGIAMRYICVVGAHVVVSQMHGEIDVGALLLGAHDLCKAMSGEAAAPAAQSLRG